MTDEKDLDEYRTALNFLREHKEKLKPFYLAVVLKYEQELEKLGLIG
jgi:hypothetical protein